ncbi:fungal-specific transcription factor domain-containing protein [Staphylotrichum tortipilum]|uniref:Fungal-specific transcription factor domain-containing protein n=1 Tax=Staphylotrichum tortipilum TaxID=2831512 RepID=A0AAN6MIQ8_9PEZI|nr:fungal-specific transcription factor domain-containing protein [Staphylotrichum longicolle]
MGTAPDPADSTSVFLERAFCFYDVIAALSNGTCPLSPAPAPGCLIPLSPLGAPSASPLSNVDTLLGMATTLWPIIHRLAGLRALKTDLATAIAAHASPAQIAVLRTEFRSTTQAIESALLAWQPRPSASTTTPRGANQEADEDPVSSITHNALAYRHASLVHLHRTIHLHPRSHPTVQLHAHLALKNCVATATHGGPLAALLWPLFVAACEAVTETDRDMARRAFAAVEKRQGMRNIGRAWGVVGEVWRREKEGGCVEGEGGELWRRVCGEMGVSIVFG